MNVTRSERRFDTVVVGGGQAGLAVGYYLAMQGRDFVILDAHHRIGTSWRERWDSLRLFTPAWISSLPGMPLSAPAGAFLTKNEVADYLEAYAARFHLPVRLNTTVDTLTREGALPHGKSSFVRFKPLFSSDSALVCPPRLQRRSSALER